MFFYKDLVSKIWEHGIFLRTKTKQRQTLEFEFCCKILLESFVLTFGLFLELLGFCVNKKRKTFMKIVSNFARKKKIGLEFPK